MWKEKQVPVSWQCASVSEMKRYGQMVEKSPVPLCITPEALQAIMSSVGSYQPETGAKGFGPVENIGLEIVEPDPASLRGMGAVYRPDAAWGEQRLEYYRHRQKLWTGDIHSHWGDFGIPSGKAGKGLGDLGYVEEVFQQNETMQFFFIPIVTGVGTAMITIWPWVCQRGEQNEPILMFADLSICAPSSFPVRPFNPKWEQEVEDSKKPHRNEVIPVPKIQPLPLKKNSEERRALYVDKYGYIF